MKVLQEWRQRLTPGARFVCRKYFTFRDTDCQPGDPPPQALLENGTKLRRLWESGKIQLILDDPQPPIASKLMTRQVHAYCKIREGDPVPDAPSGGTVDFTDGRYIAPYGWMEGDPTPEDGWVIYATHADAQATPDNPFWTSSEGDWCDPFVPGRIAGTDDDGNPVPLDDDGNPIEDSSGAPEQSGQDGTEAPKGQDESGNPAEPPDPSPVSVSEKGRGGWYRVTYDDGSDKSFRYDDLPETMKAMTSPPDNE